MPPSNPRRQTYFRFIQFPTTFESVQRNLSDPSSPVFWLQSKSAHCSRSQLPLPGVILQVLRVTWAWYKCELSFHCFLSLSVSLGLFYHPPLLEPGYNPPLSQLYWVLKKRSPGLSSQVWKLALHPTWLTWPGFFHSWCLVNFCLVKRQRGKCMNEWISLFI